MAINNYTKIHLHSELSNGTTNIDSITKYSEYVKRASELGMKAICFTEHGNVFNWVKKKMCVEEAGMKYIHGCEFYVTETLNEKIRDNYHCVLIAKNYEGVLELNRLSSRAYCRDDNHFYYSPRISFDELISTSDNLIITTACLGGILNNGNESLKQRFIDFLSRNKHRCYLEIQHHSDEKGEQRAYNIYLYKLSKSTGIPLVAGTDTHALSDEHMDGRRVLQIAKKVHFANEDSWDLTFKSYDELISAYQRQGSLPMDVVKEAIQNTNVIADSVEEFELDFSYKYPKLWEDPEKVFLEKIDEGIRWRGIDKYPNYNEYLERIEHELAAYKHNGAIDFMLLMDDIIKWCLDNDIQVGYGRGSVNGSVIAYILGITEMDSIKHKLNFERFMNVERVSLSDIDTDLPPSKIDDVKQYIYAKTGLYCCDIITFNTCADKGSIRDIGRALNIPLNEVAYICDNFEKEEQKLRKKYKELFKYVDLVKGTIVSVGVHPCGLVVAPYTIDDRIGTFTSGTSRYPISQLNMKEIDLLNYVKLDLLKLDTIELINETCKSAGIERLTPDNIDITDVAVWNSIRDDTTAIFQWEGSTGNDYIKKLLSDENIKKFQEVNKDVDRMTLLSIGNSAIRPAGASYRDDLANGVIRTTGIKAIDDFLSSTFGYLVFQCQIIEFLHVYCGFTMGEADIVRRHFAKKTGTEKDIPIIKYGGYMDEKNKSHYIKGYIVTVQEEYGQTQKEAEESIEAFLEVIIDASRYLFSLNHSQPYSYEGYVAGWLRYYYTLEFLTEALNISSSKEEKTIALTKYAKKVNISIKDPVFRYSKGKYFFDKESNSIYKGIGSIKYMNNTVGDELYNLRNTKCDSFIDLMVSMKEINFIDARQLNILIKIDYFREFGHIGQLLRLNELFSNLYDKTKKRFKRQMKKENICKIGLTEEVLKKFSHRETEKTFMQVDMYGMLKHIEKEIKFADISNYHKASYQQLFLKHVKVVDKKEKNVACVVSVDTKYSPRLQCYAFTNGDIVQIKISRNTFNKIPLEEGDVIKINNINPRPRQKLGEDGEFHDIEGTKEWWVSNYKILVKAVA